LICYAGTVTASPSPLGLSLTPPPTLGGSLGGLVGGASRVSAAPGAEAKFRASAVPALTANGVFGSSSSLFPNLVGKPGRGGAANINDKNSGGRSRLLEDFRNNRYNRWNLLLVLAFKLLETKNRTIFLYITQNHKKILF